MFRSRIDIPTDATADQDSALQARQTLKTIQDPAIAKENLVQRQGLKPVEHVAKRKKMFHKSVQTGEASNVQVTAEDLTSETASDDYWRILAEKRGSALDESFKENEQLKDSITLLKEENRKTQEVLDDSRSLIAVLQEMLTEGSETEVGDEIAVVDEVPDDAQSEEGEDQAGSANLTE